MNQVLNDYLTKMEKYLKVLPASERIDIVNELKSEKLLLESTMSTNLNSNLSSGMCYFKSIASNINDLTPDVVNRLIDKIEVSEDGTPRIYYRFSESSICLSDFINQTS